ncbi:MAG TPA: hypothetical protein VFC69_02770 [Dysgonamonadaceae bacterium]|nr:hypothetical protein [Dysgonamonadaceae bacterium]
MSKKCPLCGDNKTEESLFCAACTDRLNSEYEVDVPLSEKRAEEGEDVQRDDLEVGTDGEGLASDVEEKEEAEATQKRVEERAKAVGAPNFDKSAWKKQREDRRSGSDKSYYELLNEEKSSKRVVVMISLVVVALVLVAGLYVYNKSVKDANLERSKWEVAQRENTIDGYLAYMEEYLQGEYTDEAYERIQLLKSREWEAWQSLMDSESIIEFTSFLEQYPESPYERKVKSRLDSLLWQSSLKENTTEAYSDYMDKAASQQIGGDYIGEAKKRLKMLSQTTPIDGGDLENIKSAVDGFFAALSVRSQERVSEQVTPTLTRLNSKTNLPNEELLGELLGQVASEGAKLLRLEADAAQLKYERMGNDTYEVNVPIVKVFESDGGEENQIKGYIVHLKLSADFKIFSYYETKPYATAP